MPGPLQYGNGIKALKIDLLVAQMLSLRRCTELEHAITGLKISEATFLSYIERINDSLQPWKAGAKKLLLTRPALHVDETGFRVDKKKLLVARSYRWFLDTQVPASQAGQGSYRRFWHHSVLLRCVDP